VGVAADGRSACGAGADVQKGVASAGVKV
jgi:hypothetical protein